MRRIILSFTLNFIVASAVIAQCNQGLKLGTVIVPTHGNSTNGGNFASIPAWQEAANLVDTLNLDYWQRYISWVDVVSSISGTVTNYKPVQNFVNQLGTWTGNADLHIVYPVIKVGVANKLDSIPQGFGAFTSFLDPNYINQNYNAIKYMLTNINNVKHISIGNEIDTYFGGAYLNTGRLTKYATFLDTIRKRINIHFPTVKVGTILAFHALTFNNDLNMVDSILNSVDFVGYTFYYTTNVGGTCWDSPATVKTWLNSASAKTGSKKMMLTETCMGEGGGTGQNCGSPSKQLAYADTVLRWYKNNPTKVEGMTWFTVTDPWLGWQTPSTLWNTAGLVDSNGVTIQPAGTLWRHQCPPLAINDYKMKEASFTIFPNPCNTSAEIILSGVSPNARIEVYTLNGVKTDDFVLNGEQTRLSTEKYPAGIYYLKVYQDHYFISKKLTVLK